MDAAIKAPRDQRPESCLHCVLMSAVEEWFRHHGERESGKVKVDVVLAVSKLTECAIEIINEIPDRSNRRRALRFFHDAIEAARKSQQTGRLVPVDIPAEN